MILFRVFRVLRGLCFLNNRIFDFNFEGFGGLL
jgi:hypothetical protein